jgi:hypothetical protein
MIIRDNQPASINNESAPQRKVVAGINSDDGLFHRFDELFVV